jgi:hypothetical protein
LVQDDEQQTKNREEFGIFVDRFMNFMNLWTIYSDLLTGYYVPSLGYSRSNPHEDKGTASQRWTVDITVMLLLYAYFYSLVEDSDEGVNGFRLWRERHPEEIRTIEAVEAQVAPFLERLRLFRNRLGFHGSRSREHESRGFELFNVHSGNEIFDAMKNFKALGAALLAKENVRQGIGPLSLEQVRQWIDRVAERAQSA